MPNFDISSSWYQEFVNTSEEMIEQTLRSRRYEHGMIKPVFSRPESGRDKPRFVPNNFREVQQREPFDVRYSSEEFSHFFGPANLNVTFDKQDEMDQEQFNYNLREAEREIRLLKDAAQSGNPFAQRELQHNEVQNRIQNEIELQRVRDEAQKRNKKSILDFEESNKKSILEYQKELNSISDLVQTLVDEIRASEVKLFVHYQQIQKNQDVFINLNSKYNEINIFIGCNKPNLGTNNSLYKIVSKKEQISYWLYQCTATEKLLIHFNSEINFRDTLSQLMNLQKEFIEAQVKYKAFPIYPNPNVIEMPKQFVNPGEKYGAETIRNYSSSTKIAEPPRRVTY